MSRALWLPEKLRAFGVTVREHPGWQTRGGEPFTPKVVIAHHTANPNKADAPSLKLVVNGRSDLPGPLCQVLLSRSGIAYVVASGKANHAGAGSWKGISGNTAALGIEAENDGVGEPWSAAQLAAYDRTCAAMLDGIGRSADFLCGHKEWAPTRKVDPRGIDMGPMRARVAALLKGGVPVQPEEEDEDMMVWDKVESKAYILAGNVKLYVQDTAGKTRLPIVDHEDLVKVPQARNT